MSSPLWQYTYNDKYMSGEYSTKDSVNIGEYLEDFLSQIPSNAKNVVINLSATGSHLSDYQLFDDDSGEFFGKTFTKAQLDELDSYDDVYLDVDFTFGSQLGSVDLAVYRITFEATWD